MNGKLEEGLVLHNMEEAVKIHYYSDIHTQTHTHHYQQETDSRHAAAAACNMIIHTYVHPREDGVVDQSNFIRAPADTSLCQPLSVRYA